VNGSRVLALVPPEGPGIAPETVLLGLPLIRRTVLAARRAGFGRVLVVDATPGAREAVKGTLAETSAKAPTGAIRLEWNRVAGVRDLERVAANGSPEGIPVGSPDDLRRAERHLLRDLVKDTEGFMSRHVERKISLAVSRVLAATPVTPNAMTLVSVAIGLAGAPFFVSARPAMQLTGALLFLLHSILDGCDGELARLRFQESRWGGILDFWGDNVVHVAVFAAMAFGLQRDLREPWPLVCGVAALAGTLASATFVYRTTMSEPKEGPLFTSVATSRASRYSRAVDAVSRRDFIYLVLILSAFGKAHWFVVLVALGAPIFFLSVVGIAWGGSRAPRKNA
jgi:phosphatidylglycerophosphate synthase